MSRLGSRRDRGAAAVEFALVVPTLVVLAGLVVGGARVWLARAGVDQIAGAAARGASLARSPAEAEHDGRRLAELQAATEGLRCRSLAVHLDASGLTVDVGQPSQVSAHVRCAVSLSDVLVPGWPGELVVMAEASSIVDRYRGRQ